MGVVYLLAYVFGTLLITVGVYRFTADLAEGKAFTVGLVMWAIGLAAVLVAGLLQATVTRKRADAGMAGKFPKLGLGGVLLAIAVWLGPLAWSWIQFEMHHNPVSMHALISIAGACALAVGVAQFFARDSKYLPVWSTISIPLGGLPAGILILSLFVGHYNYHLTDVAMFVPQPGGGLSSKKSAVFEGTEPSFHATERVLGSETSALLEALANAELVDVEAEIAAGRMKRAPDGSLMRIQEDGSETPIGSDFDFDGAFERARQRDERGDGARRKREREAFEAELEARRRGGRIFGR